MPKLRLKRLKRWAASMVRYGGHISRSLYQGLSSMSLVKRRGTLRMTLAGRSAIGAAMARGAGGSGGGGERAGGGWAAGEAAPPPRGFGGGRGGGAGGAGGGGLWGGGGGEGRGP